MLRPEPQMPSLSHLRFQIASLLSIHIHTPNTQTAASAFHCYHSLSATSHPDQHKAIANCWCLCLCLCCCCIATPNHLLAFSFPLCKNHFWILFQHRTPSLSTQFYVKGWDYSPVNEPFMRKPNQDKQGQATYTSQLTWFWVDIQKSNIVFGVGPIGIYVSGLFFFLLLWLPIIHKSSGHVHSCQPRKLLFSFPLFLLDFQSQPHSQI